MGTFDTDMALDSWNGLNRFNLLVPLALHGEIDGNDSNHAATA